MIYVALYSCSLKGPRRGGDVKIGRGIEKKCYSAKIMGGVIF